MFEVVADLGFNGKYDIFHNTDALDMFDRVRDCNNENPSTQVILLQTVSGDLMMNAGIARQINNRYGFKDYILGLRWRRLADKLILHKPEGSVSSLDNTAMTTVRDQFIFTSYLDIGSIVGMLPGCPEGYIWALVTKGSYRSKPTMQTMATALSNLRAKLIEDWDKKHIIVMPAIGCGLDKMKWEDVYYILQSIFAEVNNVKFVICFREEDENVETI